MTDEFSQQMSKEEDNEPVSTLPPSSLPPSSLTVRIPHVWASDETVLIICFQIDSPSDSPKGVDGDDPSVTERASVNGTRPSSGDLRRENGVHAVPDEQV